MEGMLTVLFLSLCLVSLGPYHALAAYFDITGFGTQGNGITDDTLAFELAWKALCEDTTTNPTLLVPEGRTFSLRPILFKGPCIAPTIYIKVQGTISAPNSLDGWRNCYGGNKNTWIYFDCVNGLVIDGSGKFDGHGEIWWRKTSNTESCNSPSALAFNNCNNLRLSGTTHLNSPKMHIVVCKSMYVDIGNIYISAPEDSPNTDGLNIGDVAHFHVHDSVIQTGDDCVAIKGDSFDVNVTGVRCGPGHGISIGGLGREGDRDIVEHVNVINCNFTRTQNGARIKTWPGGSGYVKSILFEQVYLSDVDNPIIIDQHYCGGRPCEGMVSSRSAVQVSDVTFRQIQGSAATRHGITLDCSEHANCTNIILDQVMIEAPDVVSVCHNVQDYSFISTFPIVACN